MRRFWCTALAGAALVGGSMWANAQDPAAVDKKQGGAASQTQRAPQAQPQRAPQAQPQRPPQAQSQAPQPRSQSVARPQKSEGAKARSVERKAPERAARPKSEANRTTQVKRAAEPKQRAETRARDAKVRADTKREAQSNKATDAKQRTDAKARDAKVRDDAKREARKGDNQKTSAGRLQVTEQHRLRLRETAFRDRAARTNVRFVHSVGRRVPRSVRLFALPAAYLAFAPEYRDYRYVIVDDDICIVDPNTYEIVAVVDEVPSVGPGQRVAGLELTAEERDFIVANAPRDDARANVRVRLALGAEIPSAVMLVRFPEEIITVVPKVQAYRYVVVDESVVIVDPRTRGVALVITD